MGARARARVRARERRRRVFVVLLEAMAVTGVIGAFPPLRAMWVATGVLAALLGAYVWLLLSLRAGSATERRADVAPGGPEPVIDAVALSDWSSPEPSVVVLPRGEERSAAGAAG